MNNTNEHSPTLMDDRFQFLVDLGFEINDVNDQTSLWADGIIDGACEEYMRDIYCENINTLKSKDFDERFILYLFFIHTDSFAVYTKTFVKRLKIIENEIGIDYESVLYDDFWNNGECKVFDLIGWLTADENEWLSKVKELCNNLISVIQTD